MSCITGQWRSGTSPTVRAERRGQAFGDGVPDRVRLAGLALEAGGVPIARVSTGSRAVMTSPTTLALQSATE